MLLGEILLKKRACKEEDIEKALQIQASYGGRIGNILLNMGAISEEQLLEALSTQFDIPILKKIDNKIVDLGINKSFFASYGIYPIEEDKESISVVLKDPLNLEGISIIENTSKKKIKLFLTTEENLRRLEELCKKKEESLYVGEEEIEKLKELALEEPVIKLVNNLISKAMEVKATDIHFESLKKGIKVRFRVDGILKSVENISEDLKLPVITRLKLISGMNISENRLPQDGRIAVKIAGKEVDIRASSVPTKFGESFVLRLLEKGDLRYSLDNLGFYPDHVRIIREIYQKPNGIFLTTGPTGSGKTTTLYSMLNELNSDSVKIITVEDPIEYEIEGINQIQVKPEIGYTFSKALRSILRQDPDMIMIGEIRDKETAEIAIQAALTGHLVLSTLHTNSALSSITRLLDMGVEFFLLKASIIGLMAQRLVRRLCPACSESVDLRDVVSVEVLKKIEEIAKKYDFVRINPKRAKGCELCLYTGYKGRLAIAEVVPFTAEVQKEFEKNKNFDDLTSLGIRSIFEDGVLKFLEGKTSFEEVLRVVK